MSLTLKLGDIILTYGVLPGEILTLKNTWRNPILSQKNHSNLPPWKAFTHQGRSWEEIWHQRKQNCQRRKSAFSQQYSCFVQGLQLANCKILSCFIFIFWWKQRQPSVFHHSSSQGLCQAG